MTFGYLFKKLLKSPAAVVGMLLLLAFALVAIFAPVIAPVPEDSYDPQMIPRVGLSNTPKPPDEEHIFGTTARQLDVFYGVVWGTRTAFRIGIGIAFFTSLIGLIIGSISAFFGGWIDDMLMRITEVFQAFPSLLIVIILSSVLQYIYERGDGGIFIAIVKILGLATLGHSYFKPLSPTQLGFLFSMVPIIMFGWMEIARVIRGNILVIKNTEYAMAARMIGGKDSRILFRHLVPNAIFPLFVMAPLNIGSYVLTFASLGFLGLGVREGYADWGQMLSLARNWLLSLQDYYYIAVYPGLAVILFVLAWNLVGDAMRDIFDPRFSGRL
jgi:peptide/nickel transport system permease protein